MSLEPGGRADKYGNKYENRYLAKLLLRLVKEEISSVIVEPLGENSDSVEFISEQKDGTVKHYQCKASNTIRSSWNISDLRKYKVFERAKKIVSADIKNLYYFISPLPYNELDELCKRTRTNSSYDDFVKHQLTNARIKRLFSECINEFGLNENISSDVVATINILSNCFFEQYIIGTEAEQDLEEYIGTIFTGKASNVRILLEQYANDTGCYGIKITANDIISYLEDKDIHLRNYYGDKTVLKRIHDLNSIYWDYYHAINKTLMHRTATDKIITSINDGQSVILHGKAGIGKSGCLEETIYYLKQTGILYLSIKLDKCMPNKSADAFGQDLGLPESPVYCLTTMSAGKPCVLIMDQLDALRWTINHSSSALDVCKELIQQADAINKYSKGKISIVFASRTFDLENNKGLKELFISSNSPNSLRWTKVSVDQFTKYDVIKIIGQTYNQLSSRLQNLLLTPSSLYVWSKLESNAQKNSIASVYELMNAWWQQIQKKCISFGLQVKDIIDCKERIVGIMEKRSVFSLPYSIFVNQVNEIFFLVSLGLLNNNPNTKSISFTHQSFLDYFITADILEKVYFGDELEDLIGDRNHQTPIIRYRLLTVLQNLLDSDPSLFVKQSIRLLESDNVRFYFKCTVFDIIGQCDAPTSEICQIVDNYIQKAEWSNYIIQVVLYGHPVFIMRSKLFSYDTFPSNELLSLLKSICHEEPDFVINILRPFAFENFDQDRKIFWVLNHNTSDDSNDMFNFKVKLLQRNPSLFKNLGVFPELIKQLSPRAINLFEIIIECWPNDKVQHFYISESSDLNHYIKQYAWQLVNKLFPKICDITSNYLPCWPDNIQDDVYEDWISRDYHESTVREIIEIVKGAFEECAKSSSDKLFSFIRELKYPLPAVGHECIMHAVLNLPIHFADKVMAWLLEDIDQKIFVFSSSEGDYLSYSIKIIKKYSSFCNITLFRQLEDYICTWKESSTQMKYMYNTRIKIRKINKVDVFYAYWGHFQKALLPSLDPSRLLEHTKQILGMVNRNPWIKLPHFYCGYTMTSAKIVSSPIDNYTDRLSDQTWLKIISTPPDKMSDIYHGTAKDSYFIEANHITFASALGIQAKREPLRFTKLALLFPDNCYEGYILHILYALYDNTSKEEFDVKLVSKVIKRYWNSENFNIAISISRIIEKHAIELWSDDIIDILGKIAQNHPHPDKDEYNITINSDPEHKSALSLLNNSINCARGCALHAIAALLWNHHDWGDKLKNIIISASKDPNPAVRFAVMNCLLLYYNIDKIFSIKIFTLLNEADLRIMITNGYWDILTRDYDNHSTYYREKLISACLSEDEALAKHAAGLLCTVGIYHNDQAALKFILSYQFSSTQYGAICLQAVSSFKLEEYHENSKKVLTHLIDHSSKELHALSRLFFDRCIVIQRDEEFLVHLMESSQGMYLIHHFFNYIYESDEDICRFASIINAFCNKLHQVPSDISERLIVTDLIKCVVRLLDKGKDDTTICDICLNTWDNLFMSNLYDIKPLSDMIDNFE